MAQPEDGDDPGQSWGSQLKRWRESEKNWTQEDLKENIEATARRLKLARGDRIDVTLIRKWERGATKKPQAHYRQILSRLGAPSASTSINNSSSPLDIFDEETNGRGDLTFVADLTPDGRTIFVPRQTNRRGFLTMISAAAAGTLFSGIVDDIKPVDFYESRHAQLIDFDNAFGPRNVVPLAEQHVSALSRACTNIRGADLVSLQKYRVKFAEFCSWLYQDLGDHLAAQQWASHALDWSYACGDTQLTSYIMARKSQLAGDMRDSLTASGIGQAAASMSPYKKLAAISNTFAAHGHALAGDRSLAEHSYDQARELAARPEEGCEWGAWLDDSYIDVHRAQSLTELGDYRSAASTFDNALAALAPRYHRDRGVYLARAARAHAGAGDADRAAALGHESLAIATATQSGRTATELVRLLKSLSSVDSQSTLTLRRAVRDSIKTGA